jgi:hypothetical protein
MQVNTRIATEGSHVKVKVKAQIHKITILSHTNGRMATKLISIFNHTNGPMVANLVDPRTVAQGSNWSKVKVKFINEPIITKLGMGTLGVCAHGYLQFLTYGYLQFLTYETCPCRKSSSSWLP